MKSIHIFSMAAGLALLTACGESTEAVQSNNPEEPAVAAPTSMEYLINTDESTVEWAGTKLTGGGHNGSISIQKGTMKVEDGVITEGTVVIDMSTIMNADLESEEEKGKLVGHLSSPDFFDVANFPLATFTVTKHAEGKLAGNLKLKDAEREIVFPVTMRESEGMLKATGEVVIDRTQWGVNYGSSALADAFLGDNIELKLNVVASATGS